jgi:biotin carboxyl carrier protein
MTARVLVNGKPLILALRRDGEEWIFESGGRSYRAVILQSEKNVYQVVLEGKTFLVRVAGAQMDVNGREMTVTVDDPRDAPNTTSGSGLQGSQSISAPMPGKVVRVMVGEGDIVEHGQGIVVIEAMKMQNLMKSPKDGRVSSLRAVTGATVNAGDVLAVVE